MLLLVRGVVPHSKRFLNQHTIHCRLKQKRKKKSKCLQLTFSAVSLTPETQHTAYAHAGSQPPITAVELRELRKCR